MEKRSRRPSVFEKLQHHEGSRHLSSPPLSSTAPPSFDTNRTAARFFLRVEKYMTWMYSRHIHAHLHPQNCYESFFVFCGAALFSIRHPFCAASHVIFFSTWASIRFGHGTQYLSQIQVSFPKRLPLVAWSEQEMTALLCPKVT